MNQRTKFCSFSSVVLLVLSLFTACSNDVESDDAVGLEPVSSSGGDALTAGNAPMVATTWYQSAAEFANPERGYYKSMDLLNPASATYVKNAGATLAIAIVRLDAYKNKPLDWTIVNQIQTGLAAARANGIKVILRFAYNASFTSDAPKAVILNHIAQLKPTLQANADVIAVMQAGFIGAWGEWHSSTNGLDNNTDRAAILNALLAALPTNRMVQVRTPMYKAGIYGGTWLSPSEAYTGTARARVGFHDDCYLASDSDMGTYASPIATWTSFTGSDSQFVPMGGETCAVSARTECAAAEADMAANHLSYLNQEYLNTVVNGFDTKGCGADVRKRLGYRFGLKRVSINSSVRPGGTLDLELDLKNYGFAAPFNARPVYVVLKGNGVHQVTRLSSVDLRRIAPGTQTTVATKLHVPANLAAGTYMLALWMPDEASTLQKDPRYAIRLANDGVWDAATGENSITWSLKVATSAPGTVTSSTTFAVVP